MPFVQGSKSPLFRAIGSPYGYIFVEVRSPVFVHHRQIGARILQMFVRDGIITTDEAKSINQQMIKIGVPDDFSGVIKAISAYQLPMTFTTSDRLEVCDCELSLPHGMLQTASECATDDSTLYTLEDGFNLFFHTLDDSQNVHSVINFIQAMTNVGILLDGVAFKQAYDALPAEEKKGLGTLQIEDIYLPAEDDEGHAVLVGRTRLSLHDNEDAIPNLNDPFLSLGRVFTGAFGDGSHRPHHPGRKPR